MGLYARSFPFSALAAKPCRIGFHSTLFTKAASEIGMYVSINSGNVNINTIFFHAGPSIFFHSDSIVTAPNRNRLNEIPLIVIQIIRPSIRSTRYVINAGCARLLRQANSASASTPSVTRL